MSAPENVIPAPWAPVPMTLAGNAHFTLHICMGLLLAGRILDLAVLLAVMSQPPCEHRHG